MSYRTFDPLLQVVHLMCLALWGGGALFFSYLATPRIFGYLRDQLPASPPPGVQGLTGEIGRRLAGDTVGAVFPTYFAFQIMVGAAAAAAGLVLAGRGLRLERVRCWLVLGALAVVTLHTATVYQRSVQILDAHYQAQAAGDSAQADALRRTFGMWHGISQLLNMITIALVMVALALASLAARDSN